MESLKEKKWLLSEVPANEYYGVDEYDDTDMVEMYAYLEEDVKETVLQFEDVIENIDYTKNPEDIKILLKSWKRKIFGDWEDEL